MTDAAGKTATVATRPDEPALRYPAGEVMGDATFGDMFTGRLPLTTVRIPMSALQGVDKTDIREIALVFDRAPSGSLFLADLEWVRAESSSALQFTRGLVSDRSALHSELLTIRSLACARNHRTLQ